MANSMLFLIILLCSFEIAFTPQVINFILLILYNDSKTQAFMRRQISDLKSEMAQINMVAEFARYAKIQRKINKVTEELSKQIQQQSALRLKARVIISSVFYSLNFLVVLILLWKYGSDLVLEVPSSWLFPLNYVILKTSQDNTEGVSTASWLLVSGTVAKIASNTLQKWLNTKSRLSPIS